NYVGTTIISANGGQGGTEDDGLNLNHCYGSGGGGGGGAIYFSGAVPGAPVTTSVAGGGAGPEINHDGSCNAAVASSPGLAGQIFTNYTYSSSLVLSNTYCSVLLPVELSSFTAQYVNSHTALNWITVQPELVDRFIIERSTGTNDWVTIYDQPANDVVQAYYYDDPLPLPGNNYYRIKVLKKNNVVTYSVTRKILVPEKSEAITIYPNPAGKKIFVSGITSPASLKLFDLSGKLLWQKTILTNQSFAEVELPSLPAAVYMLRVGNTIKKIIIH
ncbi:MAG: T9SS type A sorting domain-containing protein, partial [Bacteroidota bacterium]|nr:T9SS type A sorting domain-containing protein [Bacteroidota bacterium]